MLIGRGIAFLAPGTASGGIQLLDTPSNNFDVAGVPSNGPWSSGLFDCWENMYPSCILSFFCPCIMFGQIVTRAQVPLCISIKNSFMCFRNKTGYGFFIDIYFWTFTISVASLVLLILFHSSVVNASSNAVYVVLFGGALILLWVWMYMNAHIRMALREKYNVDVLPCFRSRGGLMEWALDSLIAVVCLPCSLSQLARHVFQYDSWSPRIGFFTGDPSRLPALEDMNPLDRPQRSDTAGLSITPYRRPDGSPVATTAANINASSSALGRSQSTV